jgi:peptidoglycan/xylan/chitin deacetylase (PgdA/CDA1 family)
MVAPIAVLWATVTTAPFAQPGATADTPAFAWPAGRRAALTLTFDDARSSQLTAGVPLFAERGVKVTFYLSPNNIGGDAAGWRKAAEAGHEMGNHSMTHPCSGNFAWARERALEDFTLQRMRNEMTSANRAIEATTGVTPTTFAYPCGQTFIGRGAKAASYVPLAAELFLAARGWLAETSNDPGFVDLAQVLGYPMDDVEYAELKGVVDDAVARGQWLVLAGHDIGTAAGPQVTRVSMLRDLLDDVARSERGVWVGTVAEIAAYIRDQRSRSR